MFSENTSAVCDEYHFAVLIISINEQHSEKLLCRPILETMGIAIGAFAKATVSSKFPQKVIVSANIRRESKVHVPRFTDEATPEWDVSSCELSMRVLYGSRSRAEM